MIKIISLAPDDMFRLKGRQYLENRIVYRVTIRENGIGQMFILVRLVCEEDIIALGKLYNKGYELMSSLWLMRTGLVYEDVEL